ncbi:MAG: hypothetical protein SGI92_06680 [Bryobacteraceae bacterium]|nr:hypothetical protein [Bryobacteraceae bacterium]
MRRVIPLALACWTGIFSLNVTAQEYRRHNVSVTAGAGLPRGELRPLLNNSFGAGVNYHYRLIPYLAPEVGFDTLFGAAGVRDFLDTDFGSLRIRDYQQFLTFGGRVILPVAKDRVQFYGGGGGAYLRYSERLSQPFQGSNFRVSCPVCSLRDGVGYYAKAGVDVAVDRAQHFRIGAGVKVMRGATGGDPLGALPGFETADRWVNLYASFGFSF